MFCTLRLKKNVLAAVAVLVAALLLALPFLLGGGRGADPPVHEVAAGPSSSPRTVYLTFDDGPSSNTAGLLDVLAARNVKATFFVTGQDLDVFDEAVGRAYAEGHLVALHTFSHDFADIYSSTDAFWADIDKLSALISGATGGHVSAYLRVPGGSSNTVCRSYGGSGIMKDLISQCAERGIVYCDWNVDTADAVSGAKSADAIVSRALKQAEGKGNIVILMHDGGMNKTAAEATDRLITEFEKLGCVFDTLDHLAEPVHHNL